MKFYVLAYIIFRIIFLGNMIITQSLVICGWRCSFCTVCCCLQQLLEICSDFAVSHNVVFNVNKSQCLIINSKHDLICHPLFHFSGAPLRNTDCYIYLGQLINSSLSDDDDIMKQTRSLYARCNMIMRKFASASLSRLCYLMHIVPLLNHES